METKKAIRKHILSKRNFLTKEERQVYSWQIREKLYQMKEYKESRQVLLYLSYGTEADTWKILAQCLQEEKEVYCPKVLGDGVMEFFRVCSLEDIEKGYQGIMEPVTTDEFRYHHICHSTCDDTGKKHNILMVMPLTVFDNERNRIGYGKGFYDRYLMGKEKIKTIALAYDQQEYTGIIPADNYDIKPDVIITQTKILEVVG